jgi:hypothetical protein
MRGSRCVTDSPEASAELVDLGAHPVPQPSAHADERAWSRSDQTPLAIDPADPEERPSRGSKDWPDTTFDQAVLG